MTPEQQKALALAAARRRRAEAEGGSTDGYLQQGFSGLLEGATGALGAPVDLVNNLLVRPATKGINAVFGTDIQPSDTPLGGSAGLRQGLAIAPPSPDVGPQIVRRTAQSVGGAAVPLAGSTGSVAQILAGLGSSAAGGAAGAVAQQVAPDNLGVEIAAELAGGLGTGAAISGLANRSAQKAAESAVPSIATLKDEAGQLYRAAEARGVVADPTMTTSLSSDVADIARKNELITPTGRVSTAYPKAKEALDLMTDYAGHPMNPTQMQVIRDTLSDAVSTTEGKERKIAMEMLRKFDEFSIPLAPELAQARDTAQRYIKAGQLEQSRELAEQTSRQKGRNFSDTLADQYGSLEKRIIKGQDNGWTPEQVYQISKVAGGTTTQNNLARVGKLAPTGPMSFIAGGGIPFAMGTAIGGPAMGSAVSGASMGAGFLARDAASRIGNRNAEIAELLTRNGGQLPQASNPEIQEMIIRALIGSNAAVQGN